MFPTHEELCEIFDLPPEGAPPQQECVEGIDYTVEKVGWIGNQFQKGNRGNPNASAPLGNKNHQLRYWYKTPLGEGIANGKKELIKLGFPPSIGARRHDHYVGGTSFRNQKWKGYEYKTLT